MIRLMAVAPVALALLIAGCGSSSNTSPGSAASSSTGSSTSAAVSTSTSSAPGGSNGNTSSPGSASSAAVITTKHNGKLGTILAYGPKKLTVYLFEADKAPTSTCSGACAQVWPPVIGEPMSAGGAVAADLGTTKRSDGRTQVTYKGHPLYLFRKDKDDGDTYGEGIEGFGAEWYVLRPSGSKVDES